MIQNIMCPICGTEFNSDDQDNILHGDECPTCKNKFEWDSSYDDEYGEYFFPVWEMYDIDLKQIRFE